MKIFAVLVLVQMSASGGQPSPSAAERKAWSQQTLETSSCKRISGLLDGESHLGVQPIHDALGWWGRGFIEGATYFAGAKAQKAAADFGLSADVVAAHVATYCVDHPSQTPEHAIQDLLTKVLKTASR